MTSLWNLRGLNLFAGLDRHEIDEILGIVTTQGFEPGSYVFRPGDPRDQLYLLHHGQVKTYVLSQEGYEKIMHIFLPGDAFGDLLLPTTNEDLPWAQALDDVVVSWVDEPAFERLIQMFPELCMNLFRHIATHHTVDMRRTESLIHTKASHRLVQTLLLLGDRLGQGGADRFELDPGLTHEDLANLIGVSRPTVSASISRLRRQGVLHGQGRCLIIHRQVAEGYLRGDWPGEPAEASNA